MTNIEKLQKALELVKSLDYSHDELKEMMLAHVQLDLESLLNRFERERELYNRNIMEGSVGHGHD